MAKNETEFDDIDVYMDDFEADIDDDAMSTDRMLASRRRIEELREEKELQYYISGDMEW